MLLLLLLLYCDDGDDRIGLIVINIHVTIYHQKALERHKNTAADDDCCCYYYYYYTMIMGDTEVVIMI